MKIAIKLCAFALYLLYILDIIEAQKLCKVPNGDAGTCINISKCKPLMELSRTKYKTRHENMYLQQSICGTSGGIQHKVCCPPPSLWNRFEASPVIYPPPITNSPIFTNSKTPTPTEAPIIAIPLAISSSEILTEHRNVPENDNKRKESEGEEEEEEEISQKCGTDTASANKIIGGEAVAIDQYPWLALLQYSGQVLACGGSLISRRFVLTAAHCLRSNYGPPSHVRLAEYNTTSFPTDSVEMAGGGWDNITVDIVPVKSIHAHPEFDRAQKFHDIGLIQLSRRANLSDFIKLICLPDRNFTSEFSPSTNFTVAGWGNTGTGKSSEIKLEVSVPYVPLEQCKGRNANVMDTKICAGGVKGKDSCDGDSGGPLMYNDNEKYYAVGVISYGPKDCGTEGKPATHTNVFKYMSWIKQTMRRKTSK